MTAEQLAAIEARLDALAKIEREVWRERLRRALTMANKGRGKGRVGGAQAKAVEIIALAAAGRTRAAIAEELGISEASVYRVLRTNLVRRPIVPR